MLFCKCSVVQNIIVKYKKGKQLSAFILIPVIVMFENRFKTAMETLVLESSE
jgi:hypothetical protein